MNSIKAQCSFFNTVFEHEFENTNSDFSTMAILKEEKKKKRHPLPEAELFVLFTYKT